MTKKVLVEKVHEDALLPWFVTEGSAGADLFSYEDGTINPLERKVFKTGIKVAVPLGYEMQIRPRSGLASKYGITVLNSPGTIDSDYREEVEVLLINFGEKPYGVKKGDRIAQAVIQKVERLDYEETNELPRNKSRVGGFGSTGV